MGAIVIAGLRELGVHGVLPEEQTRPQPFEVDVELGVNLEKAGESDALEDTVDYGEVCQVIALISQQRSYKTLERLCSAIAERLLERYDAESVWVKAAKPEPPIPLPVDEVSVEVFREAE